MKGDFNSIIRSSTPVLVDFYAEWCGPCKMQSPILLELAREQSSKINVIKLDVDKNPQVASQYEIQSIPTLLVFKQGKIIWRGSGLHSKQQLEQVIHSLR